MAKIPLRTYNREIEGMIDRGQAAQAISHGRHILKFFPKHIDTYRLLGKAFLELQRYSEAADVLERVLACVPDDFISQIGMGIIREDQGNLDAAIWHMERAFEAQPSNVGVQVELRRLHGRRDGVEPAKIRLTRGALVRMYARGELFQQAIAEARAALSEDPNRADLEVILARMYFLSGQKVAATEVCTHLLARLPFCFEANRILAEILPGTTRAEDAKLYLQRVNSMDPYLAHLTPQATSPSEVPDNAIEVEHLEWLSEQEVGQPPEWTKNLGAGWTDQNEPIPEWITGAKIEPRKEEPVVPAQEPELPESNLLSEMPAEEEMPEEGTFQPEEEAQIPEWMQQAGWQPSTGDAEEPEPTEAVGEEPAKEEEAAPIEKAEIPEWLAAIAPPEQEQDITEIEAENPDWLSDIVSSGNEETPQAVEGDAFEEIPFEPTPGVEEPITDTPIEMPQTSDEITAESMQESYEFPAGEEAPGEVHFDEEASSIPEIIPEEIAHKQSEEEEQVPEWLANLQEQQPQTAEAAEEAPATEEITGEPLESQPAKPEEELPEWMHSGSYETLPVEATTEPIEEAGIETFEAEVNLGDTQPIQIKPEAQPSPEPEIPIEEISAKEEPEEEASWLESFDVEKRADEEVKTSSTDEGGEEMPDWIQEIMADQGDLGETPSAEEKSEFPSMPAEELSFEQLSDSEQPVKSEPPISYAPEWLTAEPEITEPAASEAVEAETQFEVESPASEESQGEAISEAEPETSENDEGFAWLENLATKHGVEEDTLLVSPEERQEEPPAWIKDQPEEAEPSSAEAPPTEEGENEPKFEFQPAEAGVEETIGEEYQEVPTEGIEQEPSLETGKEPEEALPDWLKELSAEEEESAPEKAPEVAPEAEESLGWLEELTLEEAGISPAERIEESPVEEKPVVEAPTAFKEDESILKEEEIAGKDVLPDWLKGLDEEKSNEEALPVFGEEELTAFESVDKHEGWIPEMAAEPPVGESANLLEDTSPVKITPQEDTAALPPSETLKRAQEALEAHNVERSLELYDQLIQSGEYLEDTIHDLRDALYRYPIDVAIWQTLGDACMKSSRLQEALDAYTKAEELLR